MTRAPQRTTKPDGAIAEIEIIPWRKTHVIVVTVHSSPLRPHHLRSEGPARGTYVRIGSTNRAADAAHLAELSRRVGVTGRSSPPTLSWRSSRQWRSWSATRASA